MVKKIIYLLIILTCSFSYAEEKWQESSSGLKYKIEGISNAEIRKSKKAIEDWQKHTIKLFRQLDEMNINYQDLSYFQQAYEKIVFGLIYHYNVASGNKQGVPVAAVSPRSLMQKIGVRNGDIITSINDKSLVNDLESNSAGQWITALELTQLLKELDDGDYLSIEIIRDEQKILLESKVTSSKIPAVYLKANPLPAQLAASKADTVSNCGYIKSISQLAHSNELSPVEILSVNGKHINKRSSIKLSPGKYEIEVKEKFEKNQLLKKYIPKYHAGGRVLSRLKNKRYSVKTITLNVRKGKRYILAGRLKSGQIKTMTNYWKVDVSEENKACKESL